MIEWIILIIAAFLPPIIYSVWIRNTEKYQRQSWKSIIICFLWGATIAIIAALILEVILEIPLASSVNDSSLMILLTVAVIAPIAEEFTKPLALGLKSVKKEIKELEDGLIYGAVAGLGFSATENLFYGYFFLTEGLFIFIILILMRSFSACLLHAGATALTGYGFGKTLLKHTRLVRTIPFFLLAIFVHGFYNFILTYDMIGAVVALIVAFSFVVIVITLVRSKIKMLDDSTNPNNVGN